MSQSHKVKDGDCIHSIAKDSGFFPKTVWEHYENSSLRAKREDGEHLVPGDVVFVPDKSTRNFSAASGQRHRFRRKGVPAMLKLHILHLGEPRVETPFQINIDGRWTQGQTDAEGYLEVPIQPNDQRASLRVGTADEIQEYKLRIGALQPVDTIAGIQARLSNMGYDCGRDWGSMNEETKAAIIAFQAFIEHPDPTGQMDDQTRRELKAAHDD